MHKKIHVRSFLIKVTPYYVISCVLLSVQKSYERNKIILVTWQGLGWPLGSVVGLTKKSYTFPPQWAAHHTGQGIF